MTLDDLGWNTRFENEFAALESAGGHDWRPARLIRDNKISYGALLGDGTELEVVLGGKVYHDAETDAELPAVGDWVALEVGDPEKGEDHVIRHRLPRHTCLSRKVPGKSTEEQVLAANVDVVGIVTDAGQDFNPRRMERYFAIIRRSGARPMVLINKSDLSSGEEAAAAAKTTRELNVEADVHITNALGGDGVEALRRYLRPGVTLTLVGSSGVGKSTLVNQLLGEEYQWTGEVSESTGKGMHTTAARELLVFPDGGMLIDNPGIREVQMWTDATTLRESFSDLEELATRCKFGDCKHGTDAGCAIRVALDEGTITEARYRGYLKLDEEIAKLRKRARKRERTVSRRNRRDQKTKSDNRGRSDTRRQWRAGEQEG